MNKVFKVIWNHATQSFVVVSELTKSRKKLKSSTGEHSTIAKSVKFVLIATGALAAFSAQSASDTNTSLVKVKVEEYKKDAVATGKGSIAIGDGATAGNGQRNIAIGSGANIANNAFESIAIGGASKTNTHTPSTTVYGTQSIAIGGNTVAKGNSSIAIGNDDLDEANKFKYQGTDEFVDYTYDPKTGKVTNKTPWKLQGQSLQSIFTKMTGKSIQWHASTTSGGEASVAIGVQAVSNGHFGTALGSASKASGFGSVAFGAGAEATLLNSVALGAASKTDKAGQLQPGKNIFGTNYVWQGGSSIDKGDVVSIGTKGFERQLINLAPGEVSATSTDAVNGSQLYSVLNTLEKMRYYSVNSSKSEIEIMMVQKVMIPSL
ncbi:Type V secretory pathway, adhesin AidA [Aggregatibacter aphrophilus]|uniref:Type V secretory pathway, adhesin AidA n=1 Tax=Aggregatibacter aphrophilus TaxID=732 RepID=A0A336N6A7_AGGAP|nr:Type V secretory pathway, adhesin AidA [Aggregatibacter aphrophilus]